MRWSAVLAVAVGAWGGCTRAGSFDVGAPSSGFASAGDGPACLSADRVSARAQTLPTSTDVWVATTTSAPSETGVGCLNSAMNAVMTVIAYEVDRPIRQWRGEVYWTGSISDGGDAYNGYVNEDSSIRWIARQVGTVRVNTDRRGRGGVTLSGWLPGNATRVTVVVQRGYGTGAGASLAARGGGEAGDHGGTGASQSVRGAGGYLAKYPGKYDVRAGTGALDRGVGAAGPRGSSRARRGAGTDTADTRGRSARRHGGVGTSPTGTRAGSPRGGQRASWSQPPSAELSRHGGRTPRPGGVDGGSAAGRGKPGDAGLSIGIALFGGVIRVPASIAPALDRARPARSGGAAERPAGSHSTTALLVDAGVSPTALAKKWLSRGLRVTGDRLTGEIASEAAALASRESQAIRARLSRSGDFARLSAAEQDRILDAATDAVQREYLEQVERVAAAEMARLERRLARTGALGATTAHGVGTPAAHVERLMRENLDASERVWLSARQARADLSPRVAPPAPGGTQSALHPALELPGATNTVNHIFGKAEHNLGGLVMQFGSREAAYTALYDATNTMVRAQGMTGLFQSVVTVGGRAVTVRGNVIDGVLRISTAFIP